MSKLARLTFSAVARQVHTGELLPGQLDELVRAQPFMLTPQRSRMIEKALHRNPRRALAMAQVVRASAGQSAELRTAAQAELLWLRALNACTEFRLVVDRCAEVAEVLQAVHDAEGVFQVWWQGGWAAMWLGELGMVREMLAQMETALRLMPHREGVALSPRALCRAKRDWIEGRLAREQGRRQTAAKLFQELVPNFRALGDELSARLCERELAQVYHLVEPALATPLLRKVRTYFARQHSLAEVALCDVLLTYDHLQAGRYQQAMMQLATAERVLRKFDIPFWRAGCSLQRGYVGYEQKNLPEALRALNAAREQFAACGSEAWVSVCEINLGGVWLEQNRYAEAAALYAQAADRALAAGRKSRAALCQMNLGECLERQGRLAEARPHYERARPVFARERMSERLVLCDMNLGVNALQLGEFGVAFEAFRRARQTGRRNGLKNYLGRIEREAAQALLAAGKPRRAVQALKRARAIFASAQQALLVALCDEALAQSDTALPFAARIALLETAQETFAAFGAFIDAARCERVRGELYVQAGAWDDARAAFEKAQRVLVPAFPQEAWRIAYGLGQLAEGQQEPYTALKQYRRAVQTLAQQRTDAALEQWSNNLFMSHAHVYHAALRLGLRTKDGATALEIVEAAKAQSLRRYLFARDWSAAQASAPEQALLAAQERKLRYALSAQEAGLAPDAAFRADAMTDTRGAVSTRQVASFAKLHKKYEAVVTRLRNRQAGMTGMPELPSFSLRTLRERATARWGKQWAALEYFFNGDELVMVYADDETLNVHVVPWTEADAYVLNHCASPHPDMRELVYNGTLHGQRVAAHGISPLEQLAAKLLPPELAHKQDCTLLISPHRALHQIPFAALPFNGRPLLETATLLYAPSLQVSSQLLAQASSPQAASALFCGMQEFGAQARALSHTRREIEAGAERVNGAATVLWQGEATRATLLDWNRTGQLANFDTVHFATHALIEPSAPHWSRILLADEPLTVLDILDLRLSAQLVILSACATALGQGGAGDELVGFGRAFFYAGARAVMASLWPVRDEVTAELMTAFYKYLGKGDGKAQALRAAQRELHAAGHTMYDWAAFVLFGVE